MIKRFFAWLKTIYFKPAPAAAQTPEVEPMSDIPVDVAAQPAVAVVDQVAPAPVAVAEDPTPTAEAKAGVADLDAALNFIESGVAQLGEAAKDELKELAKKYL